MKRHASTVLALLIIPVFALLEGGCASIVKGTTQPIPVASNPPGANVRLDGNLVGQTPTSVEVKRKTDHLLTVDLPGYQPQSVAITRNIGGAVFGNIIAGGLIGWGVDAITGAQWNLSPSTINLALYPAPIGQTVQPGTEGSAAVFIRELKDLDAKHAANKVTDEEYMKRRTALMDKYAPQNLPAAKDTTPPPSEDKAAKKEATSS